MIHANNAADGCMLHVLSRIWSHVLHPNSPIVAGGCAESAVSTASPSLVGSQSGALLVQPFLSDQGAPLLELVPLLGVALHDITHAVSAECHNIAQLLVPPCLLQSIHWGM